MPAFLFGGLVVLMRPDLGFGVAGIGGAIAAFWLASAATSVTGGRIAERMRAPRAMLVAALASAACLLGIALLARSWRDLAVLLALGGAANGLAQPAANLALARGVPDDRQGLAFGIKQSAVPTATLLAGVAVPLVGLTVGWRWAFGLAALSSLTLAAAVPRDHDGPLTSKAPDRTGDIALVPLLVLAVAAGVSSGAANTIGAFLVESLVDTGITASSAGLIFSLGSAASITVRLVAGHLADHRDGGNLPVVAGMLVVGAGGFLALGYGSHTAVLVLATVVAFGVAWGWPGLLFFAVVRLCPAAPATASGVVQAGGGCGSVLGPAVFGLIVANASFAAAWTASAAAALLGAGLIVCSRRLLLRQMARPVTAPAH